MQSVSVAERGPPEVSYQIWLAGCIKRYLRRAGFSVRVDTVSQPVERKIPFDLEVNVRRGNLVKRFGLQVKRPYVDGLGLFWRLDREQHQELQRWKWVFYAFPTSTDSSDQEVMCHHLILARRRRYSSKVRKHSLGWPYRWGGFVEALRECRVGLRLEQSRRVVPLSDQVRELELKGLVLADIDYTARHGEILVGPPGPGRVGVNDFKPMGPDDADLQRVLEALHQVSLVTAEQDSFESGKE